ncbi:MAG: SAM-dependent chlorinase/fluorinase [Chloroflexota bacterium]|nr:SAM-dependent chlorinase/fluorinase [Chloroflexota bacterium]
MNATPADRQRPIIGFLTDFGLDGAAATCRGVMLSICRDAQIVDICHTVRKYAIADAAYLLISALPYLPIGVHVAVVDPGVGTERRPLALRAGRGDILIGPDNGLLPPAADALGGIAEARVLEDRRWWLATTTSTFHGRDIFSPVAAHLAVGHASFADVGPPLPSGEVVRLPAPQAQVSDGVIQTRVRYIDSFGNIRLTGTLPDLVAAFGPMPAETAFEVEIGLAGAARHETIHFAQTFGGVSVGTALLYIDSSGDLALADNQGNAAARLGAQVGQPVRLTRS